MLGKTAPDISECLPPLQGTSCFGTSKEANFHVKNQPDICGTIPAATEVTKETKVPCVCSDISGTNPAATKVTKETKLPCVCSDTF